MTRMQWFAVVLACAISRAAIGNPLAIRTRGALPFSIDELDAALVLRTQLRDGDASAIVAQVTGDGSAVTIAVAGRSRRVPLDNQHGADAARLVALALLDLAGDQLDPPAGRASEPATLDAPVVAAPSSVRHGDALAARFSPSPTDDQATWSAALLATAGTRQTLTLELGRRIAGRVRALVSGGVDLAAETTVMTATVTRRGVPLRVGVGWRLGDLELRAGAVAVIEQASAERATTNLLAGGGAAVVWSPLRVRGIVGMIAVGGDGFTQAIDYRVGGRPVVTTDRFAWWGGLGLAWEVP